MDARGRVWRIGRLVTAWSLSTVLVVPASAAFAAPADGEAARTPTAPLAATGFAPPAPDHADAAPATPDQPAAAPGARPVANPDGTIDVLVQHAELATDRGAQRALDAAVGRPVTIEDRWAAADAVKVGLAPPELYRLAQDPTYRVTVDTRLHATVENAATDLGVRTAAARVPAGSRNGAGVAVAVIDTGIDDRHASLSGQVVAGVSTISSPSGSCPTPTPAWRDDEGHGSHVASIVAGKGTPLGVAPAAKLVAIKALECDGSGTLSDIADGIQWAIDHRVTYGIGVINMSLGGAEMGTAQDFLEVLVNQAVAAGIVVVVAAGNAGPTPGTVGTPGAAHHAITIGAIADRGAWRGMPGYLPAYFSSRGPTQDGTHKPDLMAPGVAIVAANVLPTVDSPGPTVSMSGTSMATPFAAGVAAALLAAHPELAPSGTSCDVSVAGCPDGVHGVTNPVKALLTTTARSFGSDPDTTGAGIIDPDRAMAQAGGTSSGRSWPALSTTALWADPVAATPITLTAGGGELGVSVTCPNTTVRLTTSGQSVVGFSVAGLRFPTTTSGQRITVSLQVTAAGNCRVHTTGGTVPATPSITVASGSQLLVTEGAPSTPLTVSLADGIPTSATIRVTPVAGVNVTPTSRTVTAGSWTTPQSFAVSYPDDGTTALRAQRTLRLEVVAGSTVMATRTVAVRVQDAAGAPQLEWHSPHTGCDCGALVANGAEPVGLSADGNKLLVYVNDEAYEPGSFTRPSLVLVDRRAGTRTVVSRELDGSLGRPVPTVGHAAISGDGRTIVYFLQSPGTTSGTLIVLRDGVRQAVSGPARWISIGGIDDQGNNLIGLAYPPGSNYPQAYLVDSTRRVWLWSTNSAGNPAGGWLNETAISADGRSVAIGATWSDLGGPVPAGEVFGVAYLRRDGGPWQVISRNPDGSTMGSASSLALNADGTRVAFAGQPTTAPGGDWPLWVRDVASGTLTQITSQNGTPLPMALPERAAFSQDGRTLAFASYEPLAPDDVNATPDVYLHDLATGMKQIVSLRADGSWVVGGTFGSHLPAVSADGRTVAFANDVGGHPLMGSGGNGLVAGDTDFNPDTFIVTQPDLPPAGGNLTLANVKVLDTDQPLTPGTTRTVPVSAPAGTTAAAVTITVTGPAAAGYLVAWSGASTSPPGTSTVNWDHAGALTTTTAIVPLSGGSLKLWSTTALRATVVVTGWLGTQGATLTSPAPTRPIDTRLSGTPLRPWSTQSFPVGRPAGATGVLATFTVTDTTGPGVLLAGDRFVASWDRTGTVTASSAAVPLTGGQLRVLATGTAHLIVDVNGWVTSGGAKVHASVGRRVFDARSGLGGASFFLPPNTGLRVHAGAAIPAGATAAVITFTVVNPVAAGYLALDAGGVPTSSIMAWDRAWSIQSNTAVVPVEADGSFKLRTNVPAFVIADVVGYLGDPPS